MKGDFIGFSFAGLHSSDLDIVRVNDSDRYKEKILPEFTDIITDIPGGNGAYYFGTEYKQKTFDIDIAFDFLTEEEYFNLKTLFSVREPNNLVFDEEPYKNYLVKIDSPPEFQTVCFDFGKNNTDEFYFIEALGDYFMVKNDEGGWDYLIINSEGQEKKSSKKRIYKGNSTIHFITYFPFGRCQGDFKDLSYYYENNYTNTEEWNIAANLINLEGYDVFINGSSGDYFKIYNPGQVEAIPFIYIPYNNDNKIESCEIKVKVENEILYSLSLEEITKKTEAIETGILINSYSNLIEGVIYKDGSYFTSNNIYNNKICGGGFIKIPKTVKENSIVEISGITTIPKINYDYLYY